MSHTLMVSIMPILGGAHFLLNKNQKTVMQVWLVACSESNDYGIFDLIGNFWGWTSYW
jgi:formylglycine-generating enzyme required for sulfatase activity